MREYKMSKTYIAIPPGATIEEQLKDRGMTAKDLAEKLGWTEEYVEALLNGETPLTPYVAECLEVALGLPAKFWAGLETIYREKLVLIEKENKENGL
mgnify:CR=1 FL=1